MRLARLFSNVLESFRGALDFRVARRLAQNGQRSSYRTLKRILSTNSATQYSRTHGLGAVRSPSDLKSAHPLTTYADYHSFVTRIFPEIPLVAHCHNDLGMATANSIAAAIGGANFVQGTLGGLGERAGNAPLEELAVILALKFDLERNVDLRSLCTLAANVLRITGTAPQANKPLLGSRVFAHESGMRVKQ